MTATLSSDAIHASVTGSAELVTEYMPTGPTLVINSGTDRVYLGTGSNVGASNGVPVEAGACVTWTQQGQLWAVLDPGATSSSAPLTLTTCASTWEQSPVAVGVQVAAQIQASQLAAQIGAAVPQAAAIGAAVPSAAAIGTQTAQQANALGIPPTYTQTTLSPSSGPNNGSEDNVPVGMESLTYNNLGAYSSVTVTIYRGNTGTTQTGVCVNALFDSGASFNLSTMGRWNIPSGGVLTQDSVSWTFPCTGSTLWLSTFTGALVRVIGSNRTVPGLIAGAGEPDMPRKFGIQSATVPLAATYLPALDFPTSIRPLWDYSQGPGLYTMHINVVGTAGYLGYWYMRFDGTIESVYVSKYPIGRTTVQNMSLTAAAVHWFWQPDNAVSQTIELVLVPG